MTKIKAWVSAARLRTLPLSVSGILVGSACAYNATHTASNYWWIFSLAMLTTLLLQILSNFANDYGDGVKGTDNHTRVGPQRAVQSGVISAAEMKVGVIVTALLSLVSAVVLIYVAFGQEHFITSLFFFVLGVAAVAAAIKYTVGASAYGYRGLGDLFVFIFFGLVSTLGAYYLYTQTFGWLEILPAIAIGNLSIAVLNLNNMRDRESDQASGKNTLVVLLGAAKAKIYHYSIVITALLAIFIYALVVGMPWYRLMFVIAYLPFVKHLLVVIRNKDPKKLDPEMKRVALGTFFLALLFSLALTNI
ncbi:1,4-dihydroxy-2-naphthoate octaprenyltransferase [Flavobacterium sp. JP2137]|uniref:1,4-dihydroxy-2-naphthoate octaprenyltransferase n=1 Tax=Flavobacterium sp. JP2137 TaxID=3414510 RepID=UPI003D2FEB76